MIDETYKSELGEIRVIYNEEIARRAIVIRDALQAARRVKQSRLITGLHEAVINIILKGFGGGESDSKEVIEAAVDYVQEDNEIQLIKILNDALEIAVLNSNFADKPVRFKTIPVKLENGWHNQDEKNAERAESLLPPLPRLLPFHPDEQKCALIQALKNTDVRFHGWFLKVFDRAAEDFAAQIRDKVEASYAEKSKSGMAGNSSVEPRTVSDRRRRRGGKRDGSLPSAHDGTPDGQERP